MENMDKELTVPKWVLINWPKNTPNPPKLVCNRGDTILHHGPKTYLPKLSAQAQKFGISMKKGFIGRT